MSLDFSAARFKPFEHQIVGTEFILNREFSGNFDEMGMGKSKQVIDAAMFMFVAGHINQVMVLCPAAVRDVWYDDEFGQLADHLWPGTNHDIFEYHGKGRVWTFGEKTGARLQWVITNYDWVRDTDRLDYLRSIASRKTLLVVDESSFVKNAKSQQAKATLKLRNKCGFVVLLNGTPISQSPGDMYAQGQIMSKTILECPRYRQFKDRYCVMGGYLGKEVKEWVNLEDLQKRFAPHVIRRLKADCLDLPKKMPPVALEVPLTTTTWNAYKQMRDEMVAWLTNDHAAMTQQAAVKALRLEQITSGFVGGVVEAPVFDDETDESWSLDVPDYIQERPDYVPREQKTDLPGRELLKWVNETRTAVELGREKLDFFMRWFAERLVIDPNLKLVVWCRFRPELHRLVDEVRRVYPDLPVGEIHGGQKGGAKGDARQYALKLMHPRYAPEGPAIVVGTPQTGRMGINLTASHTVMRISTDASLMTYLQSDDRVHRLGQMHDVHYFHLIAVGPAGQKTMNRRTLELLVNKESIATWTTSAWRQALMDE